MSSRPHSCERRASRSASSSRPSHSASADGEVLRDVQHERLRGALGGLAQRRGSPARADSRSHRSTNAGTRHDIASARISVPPEPLAELHRLGEHLQPGRARAGAARPVGAHQARGEPGVVAEPARHRDRARAGDVRALVPALEVARARQPAEQADAQLRVLGAERLRRLLQQLDRAVIEDGRTPARLLVADRGPGEQRGVALLAGDRRRRRNASSASRACPARCSACPSSSSSSGRASPPSVERGAQARPRRPRTRARRGRPRAAPDVVLDGALGVPERRGGREVVREVDERTAGAVRASSASPTRRCSSARRGPDSRS